MKKGSKRTPESCAKHSATLLQWHQTPEGQAHLDKRRKLKMSADELKHEYITLDRSIYEIAATLGLSTTPVVRALKRYGIPTKPKVRHGSASGRWKGDSGGYCALHARVVALRGRPKQCQRCGFEGEGRWYDWANLTGRYDDPLDYERMCRSCHQKYDHQRRKDGDLASTITTPIHPKARRGGH